MPVLPLRGLTAFPGTILNFDVERPLSVAALNAALASDQQIFMVSQRDISTEVPSEADLYSMGTVCVVRQILRLPGGMVKVMVEGLCRARVMEIHETTPSYTADVQRVETKPCPASTPALEALLRRCITLYEDYAGISGFVTPELFLTAADISDLGALADFAAQNSGLKHTEKQLALEELRPRRRIELVNRMLHREITVLTLEKDLDDATKEEIDRAQRDYYLREQIKVIRSELGESEDTGPEELTEYREKIKELHLTEEVEEKLLKGVTRLAKQPFGSAESSVIRAYLDTCLELPWSKRSKDNVEISRAKKCLDEDHYGLDKVKERILEFLAVRQISPETKSSVLCLVGPPGVGKTSIAISVARAMRRSLARISLGGVHDEAEIRGHRKTYVGALPGRILAGIARAGTSNPVIVLDEIDKLSSDFKGDPSSALLEALDPEQNGTFHDNYLDIDYDLSNVLFITTANTTATIQSALLDRMELINVTGYLAEEKMEIARKFLVPKQLEEHGIAKNALKIDKTALAAIIDEYTHESGVRGLEKQIAKLARVTAKKIALEQEYPTTIKKEHLKEYLGLPTNFHDLQKGNEAPGVVTGLAWTQMGGEILFVESSVSNGKGVMTMTGNLGDEMKESATIAYQFIKAHPELAKMTSEQFSAKDLHVHVPEGATPKDGPSAGITMVSSMVSALRGEAIRHGIAMTGEMTLRGRVLPVGGIKEKILAAKRAGVHTIVISEENRKDIEDIKEIYIQGLEFHYVKTIQDVIGFIF